MVKIKLNDAKGDVSGRWFLYYNFPFPADQESKGMVNRRFKEYIKPEPDSKKRYALAEKKKAELEERLKRGFNPFEKKDFDPEDIELPKKSLIADLFKLHKDNKNKLRSNTYRTYSHSLRAFKIYLEKKGMLRISSNELTLEVATDFLNSVSKRKVGGHNTTRNKHRSTLKMYVGQLLENNPFEKIKKLKESREGKLPFKNYMRAEMKKFMLENDPQLYLAAQILFYMMIRPTELVSLRIGDIDFEKWKIRTRGEISKNKKSQFVIIPNQLKEHMIKLELKEYPQHYYIISKYGKPGTVKLGDHNLYRRQRDMQDRLGYTSGEYSLYSWKHTGNIAAVEAGLNLKDIQIQNRHHDLNTLDIYLRNMGAYDREQIRSGFPDL